VQNILNWDDLTTLALSRENSLGDYILKDWIKFMKHLEISPEGVDFQQTTNTYFTATSLSNIYYKSCGFRKNAKFTRRLAERAQSTRLLMSPKSSQFGRLTPILQNIPDKSRLIDDFFDNDHKSWFRQKIAN
jgi:hypothetical protein